MNFPRLAGLIALAVLALAAPVSASTPTSPAGTEYTGAVKSESEYEHILIHTATGVTITCESSLLFDWKIESHGPALTTKASVTNLSFGSCGKTTVTVLKGGTLEFHKGPGGPGSYETVTWSGFEVTVASGALDCRYFFQQPTSIFMGGLTNSSASGGKTATFHLETAKIPSGANILCPQWLRLTGAYTVTSPDYLEFD